MKTDNIFDLLLQDTEDIHEDSVAEKSDIDYNRIRKLAIKKVHSEKNTKNRKGKKRIIAVIAAALSVVIIGTTAAATGAFDELFNSKIKTQDTEGYYTPVNITGVSDEYNVVCSALTGDEHFAYTNLTITKKDGSTFINNTDNVFLQNDIGDQEAFEIECTGDEDGTGDKYISYSFEDNKTINAFVYFRKTSRNIIGQTLQIKNHTVYANIIDSYVQEIDDLFTSGNYTNETFDALYEKYSSNLREDQKLMFHYSEPDKPTGVIVTRIPIDLNFSIDIPLIHESNTYQLDLSDSKTIGYNGLNFELTSITVSPFSMIIEGTSPYSRPVSEIGFSGGLENIEVETENGEIVNCCFYGCNSDKQTGEFVIAVDFHERHHGGKVCTIDPTKIKAIYTGETEIYEKT